MIKNLLIVISAIIPLLGAAQQSVGTWKIFSSFDTVEKVFDTDSKVYFLSSTKSLYSYDKDNNETYVYGIDNKLTDVGILDIYYNNLSGYLAVAYSSGTIDIIYDDGKVVQLPDIKNAVMYNSKNIKEITFAPGRMLVLTDFGLVLYDDKKMEVKDSGIYDKEILYALPTDEYIVIYTADNHLGFMPNEKKLNNFNNFVFQPDIYYVMGLFYQNDNRFIAFAGDNRFAFYTYDKDSGTLTAESAMYPKVYNASPKKNGYIFYNADNYFDIDLDGNYEVYDIPSELKSTKLTSWNDPLTLWSGNDDGISQYSLNNGSLTLLVDKIKPEGLTLKKVGRLSFSPTGKLYISHYGRSHYYVSDWPNEQNIVNVYENGKIKDISIKGTNGSNIVNVFNLVEDPDDSDILYVPNFSSNLYKTKNGNILVKYDSSNSSIRRYVMAADIDAKGNLWVAQWGSAYPNFVHMMTNEGRKKDVSAESDWYAYTTSDRGEYDARILACRKSNIVLAFRYYGSLVIIDTKGTASNSDDTLIEEKSFTDQDGKIVTISGPTYAVEDKNGHIWIGYSKGIISITNPSKIGQPDFRINHIKVPRNDGTNYADYLLDGEWVTGISVDPSNRKWISTLNSGVYYVSEDGSQILEHFTTDNSVLPDNKVYAVACDPNSNSVYFGTMYGLVQYSSSSAPAADDYSDVYAYPNPVRPEYTGWIVVRGLMDNSLVKIADAAGNVFYQGVSEGGMITWDGCDRNGERVRTGVYYVFASQNANGSSSAAVTKILVVK